MQLYAVENLARIRVAGASKRRKQVLLMLLHAQHLSLKGGDDLQMQVLLLSYIRDQELNNAYNLFHVMHILS